jgi:uncharacterized protein YggL (DUF469 family)
LEREYVKLNSDVHLGWGWRIRDRIRSLEYDIRQQKSLIDSAQEDVYKLRARMRKVRPSYHDEVVDRLTDELIELLDGKNGYNSTSR